MTACFFLAVYLLSGIAVIRFLLPGHAPLRRIWLGLCLGLLFMMWLPALCAILFRFSLRAHFISLLPLALVTGLAYLLRDRRPVKKTAPGAFKRAVTPLVLLTVFGIVSGYLQYTHSLRAAGDGSLHVGQSTYGDLAMHVSFVTGFQDAVFPPAYTMMKGELLCYPFLVDCLSASLYMGGFSLQAALIVPGTLMMLLLYAGVYALAERHLNSRKAAALVFLLFFLNGGLGFLYTLDLSAGHVRERIEAVLTGFYQTPTNQPTPYNLRWSNLICDLLIPQRTLLAGYTLLVPCLYLLLGKSRKPREMALLGMIGGALPMVHTHSFLALGLCSAGIMIYDVYHCPRKRLRSVIMPYLLYGAAAAALALPQLITWTFSQVSSSGRFMAFHFNWSNNVNGSLLDGYLWFYVKNIGLPVVLIIMALFERNGGYRRVFAGAFTIFAAAECVRFQPNAYDNNKLLYVWYLLCTLVTADYIRRLWHKLKAFRGRYALAAFLSVLLFISALLTLWRETVSDYEAFSAGDVRAADFAREYTDREDTFLTGTQHLNPILVLAGRQIPVSADTWLYFHGYDTSERKEDVRRFYEAPSANADVLVKYDIAYIYISAHERSKYTVDEQAISDAFSLVYDADGCRIYRTGSVK